MVFLMSRHPVVPPELKHSPFTVAEALQNGLTRKQLRGRSWRRISPGLYAWAGVAEAPAVVLAAVGRRLPAGAAFSDRTAAWLHRLDLPPCDPVEGTVPHTCRVSARAGVCIRRCTLAEADVIVLKGLPVTSPLRTVFDLSRRLPLIEAVVAVDLALHQILVALGDLRRYVAANAPCRGIAQARRATELADPAAESPMESRLRMLLVLAGLPGPEVQVPLYDARGRFIGRPDLYYRAHRIGLEFDGGTPRDSLVEDNRRQNRLLNAGCRRLRFTAADVYSHPHQIIAQVRAALNEGGVPAVGPLAARG